MALEGEAGAKGGSVGRQLAAAREAAGLSLADLAASTRIQERHLAAIEAGDYAALPGRSYAIGFAKTFARSVGLDPVVIGKAVSAEISDSAPVEEPMAETFAPGDPARVPSSRFAWVAAAVVAVLAVGGFIWWQNSMGGEANLPSLLPEDKPVAAAPAAPPVVLPSEAPSQAATPAADAPVVLTAQIDGLWVKIYDGEGKQLLQKQLAKGEAYTVPADAKNPMLWTGRPDALAISVGGQDQPRISTEQKRVKDVPISASALLARAKPAAPVASAAAPIPGASAAGAVPAPHRALHKPRPRAAFSAAADAAPAAEPAAPPPSTGQ